MRYFIEMQFHGKNYHGWQIQPNSQTVQGELNEKLSILLKQNIDTIGAGRTDTGVHANHFIAHFEYPDDLSTRLVSLTRKLNQFLQNDIAIQKIALMHDNAHARFDATSRTYKYYITTRKNVFQREYSWPVYYPINIEQLNEASQLLSNYSDFSAFSKAHTDVKTNICKIKTCTWEQNDDMLVFTVTADRFLRNMVRAMVGTLVDIGRGKTNLVDIKKIMDSKDRSEAGESAPAQGLFLYKIEYPYSV